MLAIIVSVIIFGFVHPGSKLILDSGIPLNYFCIFYIGFRLLVLIPMSTFKKFHYLPNKRQLLILFIFGLVGASLQYFEFKGISDGLSPGIVTFLMFSYPIWISFFGMVKDKKVGFAMIFQLMLIIGGMFLITGSSFDQVKTNVIIYPVLASVSIAVWILMSNHLRKDGLGSITLSLYYDMFSLLVLLLLLGNNLSTDYQTFSSWISMGNFMKLFLYSIFVGLVPNLLFYLGSKKVDSLVAGTLMTMEPILSMVYSSTIWDVVIGKSFWLGAILILLGNLPKGILFKKINRGRFRNGEVLSTSETIQA